MLNFNLVKRIFICTIPYTFAGGIDSHQIRIYAAFKDEDILNSLFVFCSNNKKQLKLYLETSEGIWLTTYRIRKANFNFPIFDGNYYKIDKKQLLWIIKGLNQISKKQIYK